MASNTSPSPPQEAAEVGGAADAGAGGLDDGGDRRVRSRQRNRRRTWRGGAAVEPEPRPRRSRQCGDGQRSRRDPAATAFHGLAPSGARRPCPLRSSISRSAGPPSNSSRVPSGQRTSRPSTVAAVPKPNKARIAAAQVAAAGVGSPQPTSTAGVNGDRRAYRVAVERRVKRPHGQPVAGIGRPVQQQAERVRPRW